MVAKFWKEKDHILAAVHTSPAKLQRETTTFRKPVRKRAVQNHLLVIWDWPVYRGSLWPVMLPPSVFVNNFLSLYVRTPSEQEVNVVIEGFRDRWGFKRCVGAVDGTRIGILALCDVKVSILSSRKVWLNIVFSSGTSMWVGRAKSTMPECSSIHPCTRRGRVVQCSLLSKRGLQE